MIGNPLDAIHCHPHQFERIHFNDNDELMSADPTSAAAAAAAAVRAIYRPPGALDSECHPMGRGGEGGGEGGGIFQHSSDPIIDGCVFD